MIVAVEIEANNLIDFSFVVTIPHNFCLISDTSFESEPNAFACSSMTAWFSITFDTVLHAVHSFCVVKASTQITRECSLLNH